MTATATIAKSFSAASLDFDTLLELSRRTDPVSVLSIYLDARRGAGLRAAAIDVTNRLAELEQRMMTNASPATSRSVQEGIARLAGRSRVSAIPRNTASVFDDESSEIR